MKSITKTEAKAAGLNRYFTGEPCVRGHVAERRIQSGNCIDCQSEDRRNPGKGGAYRKARYAENRDLRIAESAEWRRANPEKAKETCKKSKEKHRGKTSQKGKEWRKTAAYQETKAKRYETKGDEIRSWRREWRRDWSARNPGKSSAYTREWQKRNPERARENSLKQARTRRARKSGAAGSYSASDIKRILIGQKHRCAACRCRLTKYHVDHIVPLSRGGSNFPSNLQVLCPDCNLKKRAKDPIDFMQSLGLLL